MILYILAIYVNFYIVIIIITVLFLTQTIPFFIISIIINFNKILSGVMNCIQIIRYKFTGCNIF